MIQLISIRVLLMLLKFSPQQLRVQHCQVLIFILLLNPKHYQLLIFLLNLTHTLYTTYKVMMILMKPLISRHKWKPRMTASLVQLTKLW
jgi:hypothetical protein